MGQIHGSGLGNFTNTAMVGEDGRLEVNSNLDGIASVESGLIVMRHRHYRVHQGVSHHAGSSFYGIPINGSASIYIAVGSEGLHFNMDSRSDGDAALVFMENTNVSDSGIAINIFNRKRDCGSTINTKIFTNPTISTAGSGEVIHTARFIGGSGADTKFASAPILLGGGEEDWLLSNGSSYWIKIENTSGRELTVDWNTTIHEHI